MQLDTITELLDIPNFRVSHMIYRTDNRLELILEHTERCGPVCSACGKVHNSPIHSKATVVVQDLPITGKRVFLHVPKRKSRCIEDGRIRVEEIDWIAGRFTKRYTEHVYRLTSITTNQEAGWFLGLDDEVVYRIDRRQLEGLAKENLSPVPAPGAGQGGTIFSNHQRSVPG